MTNLDPRAHYRGYGTVTEFVRHHETAEQRAERQSRNTTALVISVVAALVLLALLVAAFWTLGALHGVMNGLDGG